MAWDCIFNILPLALFTLSCHVHCVFIKSAVVIDVILDIIITINLYSPNVPQMEHTI